MTVVFYKKHFCNSIFQGTRLCHYEFSGDNFDNLFHVINGISAIECQVLKLYLFAMSIHIGPRPKSEAHASRDGCNRFH